MTAKNPFFDQTLSAEERISWLLSQMTLEEKLSSLSGFGGGIERLGIPPVSPGGEAAHGVEQRNDQFVISDPVLTTGFTQPLGMSATWDPELIREAGKVTGEEARVISHGSGRGLIRWAPTVDLERDPRWGRTEEAYGEDPVLTGRMATGYVKGMQGEDEKYVRIAATLKHFYGNNDEELREYTNASIDPRNKYELYLEPFRRVITEAHAEGIMTAYNRINGVPGMDNPEVQTILKDQYGLHHAVSDGMAPSLAFGRHRYGTFAKVVADAVKAGLDSMTDSGALITPAAKEAYLTGQLTEADLDRAIRDMYKTRIRLGVYDEPGSNPFDDVTEADLNSEAHQAVSRQVSRESVVLLKNEGGLLPLNVSSADEIALVGQVGDAWFHDWYGGEPHHKLTLKKSFDQLLGGEVAFADGCDRVCFETNGKYLGIGPDNNLLLTDEPEVFLRECWGEGSNTFRSVRTGKLMNIINYADGEDPSQLGRAAAKKNEPFAWMVQSIFHVLPRADGSILLTDVFNDPMELQADGSFRTSPDFTGTPFKMIVKENGLEKAVALVRGKKAAIVALGCHPTVNAKETVDRKSIAFPPEQGALLKAVAAANPNTVFVLYSNYPYAMAKELAAAPAALWNTTGSQDIGLGIAESILGKYAPAGRLNMTWYLSDADLPPITDYDIIRGKRTYRYFDREVLFPFGYGLTYTSFAYANLQARVEGDAIRIAFDLTNTGDRASDEVAQVYGVPAPSSIPKPLRQLLAFERVHDVQPGETRRLSFTVPTSEFRIYDVAAERLIVESGEYGIFAGRSCLDRAVETTVSIQGESLASRSLAQLLKADHYDDCRNVSLDAGELGFTAVTAFDPARGFTLVYDRLRIDEKLRGLRLCMKSNAGCTVTLKLDGEELASFSGGTKRPQNMMSLAHQGKRTMAEFYAYCDAREERYNDVTLSFAPIEPKEGLHTLTLEFTGDARVLYGTFVCGEEQRGMF